jgi:YfiH family protein
VTLAIIQSQLLLKVPGVVHGFTTREGGHSKAPFDSLNLGSLVGDARPAVEANRQGVLVALGRPKGVWISLNQVHGNEVVEVTRQAGRSIEADALWTRDPEAAIAILIADCVPILLADERGGAVAAVHAGWRGTEARVVEAMVKRLGKEGIPPQRLKVAIGPAIGPCCYEVGPDVAAKLAAAIPTCPDGIRPAADGKSVVDLWAMNRAILESVGVKPTQIETFKLCTSCNTTFFSHRRDQGNTGRQAGIIGLAPRAP